MDNRLQGLSGSIVAIVTPFNNDGTIDFRGLSNLIDFHLLNKTDGILVCGTTGETPTLTERECGQVISFTVKQVNGRIPVIAGTGANATKKTIENCIAAEQLGVDGLLIVGPYYNKPTASGYLQHFSEVAQSTSLPIIIYNVPGRTGSNIPTEVIIDLAELFENIIGIKEASGDLIQMMDIIDRRPEGFKIFSGCDDLAFPLMCLGGDGCISVVANQIPFEFSEMLRLAQEGNFDSARKLHYRYLELMNINFIESNPQPVKTSLAMMGLIKDNFRSPMCRMEDRNRNKLENALIGVNLITKNQVHMNQYYNSHDKLVLV